MMQHHALLRKVLLQCSLLALVLLGALIVMGAGFLVPASTPPPLQITPDGIPVVIDGEMYQTGSFRAWIPPSWTVVKLSAIGEEERVAFLAPDGQTAILISHVPLEGTDVRHIEQLDVAGRTVYVALLSPEAPAAEALHLFDTVLASITPPP